MTAISSKSVFFDVYGDYGIEEREGVCRGKGWKLVEGRAVRVRVGEDGMVCEVDGGG